MEIVLDGYWVSNRWVFQDQMVQIQSLQHLNFQQHLISYPFENRGVPLVIEEGKRQQKDFVPTKVLPFENGAQELVPCITFCGYR